YSGGTYFVAVIKAETVTAPALPAIVDVLVALACFVVTVNVALLAPAGISTLAGTCATFFWLLESATWIPPAGAGPVSVTVPVESFPPTTELGLSDTDERATGLIVRAAELEAVPSEPLMLAIDWE